MSSMRTGVNSGTHEIFSPWNAYPGSGSSLLSGPLAPSCGSIKVQILLVKCFSDIFLFINKIFNPTILLVPDEKHDFSKLVKFGYKMLQKYFFLSNTGQYHFKLTEIAI
jgi:hypothetical protein